MISSIDIVSNIWYDFFTYTEISDIRVIVRTRLNRTEAICQVQLASNHHPNGSIPHVVDSVFKIDIPCRPH